MSAKLEVLGSSSSANGYILTCGEDKLIIELGCKSQDYLKALDFKTLNINALCTHIHNDHLNPSTLNKLTQCGVRVFSNKSVAEKYKKAYPLEPLKRYTINKWKILPLEVPHGDCLNYAYHITLPDGQTLLFATDLTDFPYNIPNCNYILIECNWSEDLLIDRIINNEEARSSAQTHLELKQCIKVINRLRSPFLNKVMLLHLSNGNSDEKAFIKEIKYHCGIDNVECADKGKTFLLQNDF